MKTMKLKQVGMFVVLGAFLVSCSSTTVVRTNDPAAKIYIDDEYAGRGSATHNDQKIVGSNTRVRIEKDGCEPVLHAFSRNEELDVGALIGGLFLLVPFLWIQKYKSAHDYEFRCTPVR